MMERLLDKPVRVSRADGKPVVGKVIGCRPNGPGHWFLVLQSLRNRKDFLTITVVADDVQEIKP